MYRRKFYKEIKSVFVLGSTSTIAQNICEELALNGCQKFHFIARDNKLNEKFASAIKNKYSVDITIEKFDLYQDYIFENPKKYDVGDFDLYLVTCGSLGSSEIAEKDHNEALKIAVSNFTGLIPWLTSITLDDKISKFGRLWIFSSVAGDRGRASNYHYGASKAALTIFCEGLLMRCAKKPFNIRIFKAGYITSPMTINKAPAFLCTSPKKIAKILLRNPNKRGIEYLPFWWWPLMLLIKILPINIVRKLK